jgi:hypothetical protein
MQRSLRWEFLAAGLSVGLTLGIIVGLTARTVVNLLFCA